MDSVYEYGKLEDELLRLCKANNPDFAKIEETLLAGADVNAIDNCGECMLLDLYHSRQRQGSHLPEITQLFIQSGFHLEKHARACLSGLVFSSYDRYIFDTAKVILSTGVQLNAEDREAVLDSIGTEESYQRCCEGNHACENIYYAFYESVDRASSGRHFLDMLTWQDCIGKKVLAIFADAQSGPSFEQFPNDQYAIYDRFYFDCGESVVMIEGCPNIYGCALPLEERNNPRDLNSLFPKAVGATISKIEFAHEKLTIGKTGYRQPVIDVYLDNGLCFRFTTNFGEVAKDSEFNYFVVIEP